MRYILKLIWLRMLSYVISWRYLRKDFTILNKMLPNIDANWFCGTCLQYSLNPLSANPTKWSNTLKQFVGNLPTNCLSVFDHFVELALKGLKKGVTVLLTKSIK